VRAREILNSFDRPYSRAEQRRVRWVRGERRGEVETVILPHRLIEDDSNELPRGIVHLPHVGDGPSMPSDKDEEGGRGGRGA
jgi:hypothetical protein